MSHFSVLVITDTKPSEADLGRIMQPWHEFECTGVDDEYVLDIDVTERVEAEFASENNQRIFKGCDTIEKFAEAYGGWKRNAAGRFTQHTNPNKHWDWWQIGGRWTGHFAPGYKPDKDPENRRTCRLCFGTGKRPDMKCENGCNGCRGTGIETKWPSEWRNVGNQTRVGDLLLDDLRTAAEQRAAKRYDTFKTLLNGRTLPDFEWLSARYPIEEARSRYWADPAMQAIAAGDFHFDLDAYRAAPTGDGRIYIKVRSEVLAAARANALVTFAVVKDGKWFEKGTMGWWAIVTASKEDEVWQAEFAKLLDGLPKDYWLTIVDAHI